MFCNWRLQPPVQPDAKSTCNSRGPTSQQACDFCRAKKVYVPVKTWRSKKAVGGRHDLVSPESVGVTEDTSVDPFTSPRTPLCPTAEAQRMLSFTTEASQEVEELRDELVQGDSPNAASNNQMQVASPSSRQLLESCSATSWTSIMDTQYKPFPVESDMETLFQSGASNLAKQPRGAFIGNYKINSELEWQMIMQALALLLIKRLVSLVEAVRDTLNQAEDGNLNQRLATVQGRLAGTFTHLQARASRVG
ncbi:hypothetical protein E4U43_008278 [Claviceps pusilla]|uniref:Uncharacterized protein n=1 Tax=Claviceps pusilla TaxID=123648 RepID=A0A9P7NBL2_9HYPO|nr:hypothetical protein E4U43_008278 [Claviceps pusilla]